MLSEARAENMRLSTPTMPTMEVPERVMRQMSSMEEMPLMERSLFLHSDLIMVPGASWLKVFLMRIGIFFLHTA